MSGQFTPAVHAVIRERSGGVCEGCGAERAWDAHHRHPRKMGGTKRAWIGLPSNAAHFCRQCHTVAETNRTLAKLLGWLVPEGHDPELERFLYRGEYRLLTSDGGVDAA